MQALSSQQQLGICTVQSTAHHTAGKYAMLLADHTLIRWEVPWPLRALQFLSCRAARHTHTLCLLLLTCLETPYWVLLLDHVNLLLCWLNLVQGEVVC